MIFKPVLVEQIHNGRKTRTKRFTTHQGGREVRYKVGGVYAVQPGRGKPHVSHIEILTADVHPLGTLTPEEAREEGFPLTEGGDPVAEFEEYWYMLHGELDRARLVADYSFRRAPGCSACDYDGPEPTVNNEIV